MGSKDRQGQNGVGLIQSLKKGAGFLCALIVGLTSMQSQGQGRFNETIRFEGPPVVQPGTDIGITNYYEDSMTFTPMNPGDQFGRMGGGRAGFPENGSAFLILAGFDSLSGSRGSVSRFGLYSVDLAEFSTLYPFRCFRNSVIYFSILPTNSG